MYSNKNAKVLSQLAKNKSKSQQTRRPARPKPTRYFPGQVIETGSASGESGSSDANDDEKDEDRVSDFSESDGESGPQKEDSDEAQEQEEAPRAIAVKIYSKQIEPKKEEPKQIKPVFRKPIPQPEEKHSPSSEEEEEEEEEESSEEESESESSEDERPMFVPKFISKDKRKDLSQNPPNISSKQSDSSSAQAASNRKQKTLELAEEEIKRQIAAEKAHEQEYRDDNEIFAVDDTDDIDPEAEYAAWKVRELKRIQRERDEIEAVEKEKEELIELRNMSEAERAKLGAEKAAAEQEARLEANKDNKVAFLQRRYHKGAFFQEMDILKNRDFSEALEDDYKNKAVLPKFLQSRGRDIGLKGRRKESTLRDMDTSKDQIGADYKKPRKDQ